MEELISIIIVSWNGLHHLKICLPSLFTQKYKKIEVILVDNASDDGTSEWVKKHYPQVKIITNLKNEGFAQANNIGYKHAKGEYVLFLNNDTQVTNNFLSPLVNKLKQDPTVGCVQSKILFMDDKKRLDSVGSFLTSTGFLNHYGIYALDTLEFEKELEIFSAKGACMLFRSKVLKDIEVHGDIFDNRYFAYFEETDLCHRVWLAGLKVMYVPSSVIYHKYGATSQKLLKPFIEFNSYKNRICSYIKNLSFVNLIKIGLVHVFLCFVLIFIFLLKGNIAISGAILKSLMWNILNIKETLSKRKVIQSKIRKVKDGIIFTHVLKEVGIGYYLTMLGGWNTTKIDAKKNI